MANIENIVDELETIANSFTKVKTFIFDEISGFNIDLNKVYPAILLDARDIDVTNVEYNRDFLSVKKQYNLKLFFRDLYNISDQKSKNLKKKYGDLQLLADQYIAEIQNVFNNDPTKGISVLNPKEINGFMAFIGDNSKFVQIIYNISFETFETACVKGTFT